MPRAAAWRGAAPPRRAVSPARARPIRPARGSVTSARSPRPGATGSMTDDGLASHPFDIATDVFDPAVRAMQRAFYYQRAFTALEAPYAEGPWVHASDAALAPAGRPARLARCRRLLALQHDHRVVAVLAARSLQRLRAGDDATNIPESGNGVPDLLDEARWGLDWLLSVQVGERRRPQQHLPDHVRRVRPQSDRSAVAPYVDGEVGTMATARAVGMLCLCVGVYAAGRCRVRGAGCAKRRAGVAGAIWTRRPAEHSDGADLRGLSPGRRCGVRARGADVRGGRHARRHRRRALPRRVRGPCSMAIDGDPSPYRFTAYACLLYLRAAAGDAARRRRRFASVCAGSPTGSRRRRRRIPFGWTGRYVVGIDCIGVRTARRVQRAAAVSPIDAGAASATASRPLANSTTCSAATRAVAYMSGLPGVTRAPPARVSPLARGARRATPFLFPGAVAGGPNERRSRDDGSRPLGRPRAVWGYWDDPALPRDATTAIDARYTDNDSWSTNEMAIALAGSDTLQPVFRASGTRQARLAIMPSGASGEVARTLCVDDAAGRAPVAVGVLR